MKFLIVWNKIFSSDKNGRYYVNMAHEICTCTTDPKCVCDVLPDLHRNPKCTL